jgi:hypothetical protein
MNKGKKNITFINDSVRALTDANSLLFEAQAKEVTRNAIRDNKNVFDELRGLFDPKLNPQSWFVLSKQLAAQHQLMNQEDEDKYKYVNEFQKIKGSLVNKTQDYFVEFTGQNGTDPKDFMTWLNNDASGADAREYWNQYQEFLVQKEKEAKTKKEDEANEENALTEEEIRDWLK